MQIRAMIRANMEGAVRLWYEERIQQNRNLKVLCKCAVFIQRIITKYTERGKSHVGETRERSDPVFAPLQHRSLRNFVPVQTEN